MITTQLAPQKGNCTHITGPGNFLANLVQNLTHTGIGVAASFGADAFATAYKLDSVATNVFSAVTFGLAVLSSTTLIISAQACISSYKIKPNEPYVETLRQLLKEGKLDYLTNTLPSFMSALATSSLNSVLFDEEVLVAGNETTAGYTTPPLSTSDLSAVDGTSEAFIKTMYLVLTGWAVHVAITGIIRACGSLNTKCSKQKCLEGWSKETFWTKDLPNSAMGIVPDLASEMTSIKIEKGYALIVQMVTISLMTVIQFLADGHYKTQNKKKVLAAISNIHNHTTNLAEEDRQKLIKIEQNINNCIPSRRKLNNFYELVKMISSKHGLLLPEKGGPSNKVHPLSSVSSSDPTTSESKEEQSSAPQTNTQPLKFTKSFKTRVYNRLPVESPKVTKSPESKQGSRPRPKRRQRKSPPKQESTTAATP